MDKAAVKLHVVASGAYPGRHIGHGLSVNHDPPLRYDFFGFPAGSYTGMRKVLLELHALVKFLVSTGFGRLVRGFIRPLFLIAVLIIRGFFIRQRLFGLFKTFLKLRLMALVVFLFVTFRFIAFLCFWIWAMGLVRRSFSEGGWAMCFLAPLKIRPAFCRGFKSVRCIPTFFHLRPHL